MKLNWNIFYFWPEIESGPLTLSNCNKKPLLQTKRRKSQSFKRYNVVKRFYPGSNDFFKNNPVSTLYGTYEKFKELADPNKSTINKLYLAWKLGGLSFVSMVGIAFFGAGIITKNNGLEKYTTTKWTIATNILKIGSLAMTGTPKTFGAILMSIGSFGYSIYELTKICNTPINKVSFSLLTWPLQYLANKYNHKAFNYIYKQSQSLVLNVKNTWLLPISRLLTTGRMGIATRGIGSIEGCNVIQEFENGLIIKVNDHLYSVNKDVWNKVLENTKDLPSDYLAENLDKLLASAGQLIPENSAAFLNKILSENLNPEQLQNVLNDHKIDFFSTAIPDSQISLPNPFGSWEKAQSVIDQLKANIPVEYTDPAIGKVILYTIIIVGVSIITIIAAKEIYHSSTHIISSCYNGVSSIWNKIYNTSTSFWKWIYGTSDIQNNNVPVNNIPVNNIPVNNIPVNNIPVNNITVNNVPVPEIKPYYVRDKTTGKLMPVTKIDEDAINLDLDPKKVIDLKKTKNISKIGPNTQYNAETGEVIQDTNIIEGKGVINSYKITKSTFTHEEINNLKPEKDGSWVFDDNITVYNLPDSPKCKLIVDTHNPDIQYIQYVHKVKDLKLVVIEKYNILKNHYNTLHNLPTIDPIINNDIPNTNSSPIINNTTNIETPGIIESSKTGFLKSIISKTKDKINTTITNVKSYYSDNDKIKIQPSAPPEIKDDLSSDLNDLDSNLDQITDDFNKELKNSGVDEKNIQDLINNELKKNNIDLEINIKKDLPETIQYDNIPTTTNYYERNIGDTIVREYGNGNIETIYKDGIIKTVFKNGSTEIKYTDGTIKTTTSNLLDSDNFDDFY